MGALGVEQEGGVTGVELGDQLLHVCGQRGGRPPGVRQRQEAAICSNTPTINPTVLEDISASCPILSSPI